VIVATTAAHRGVAFDASRALIDTLKATVPIWKHQLFDDGTDEWVGTP
jgi:molybdopterin synthase catalytic subunit